MADERLGVIERRRLGLTITTLAPLVKSLRDEGQLTGEPAVDAVLLAQVLMAQKPKEFAEAAGRDWQAFFDVLIAFLEKLLPIILQLIDLFT